jgi:hypothetical protein
MWKVKLCVPKCSSEISIDFYRTVLRYSPFIVTGMKNLKKLNSVAVVRKRTIPTERPPLVGEVF